jgi:serine/threonine protein kinase
MAGADRRVGQEIRGYRIDLLVGQGGMASVYAATHVALGRRAAVKVLAPSLVAEPSYVERLLYEARIANDVRHPNIIDIFDFVELESPRTVACIMELLEGPALSEAIRERPLRPAQAFNVTLQLADALAAVHQRGIVHRDLKPHNVMFVAPPLDDLCHVPAVKLLDFGIAKVPLGITHSLATLTGQIMGTPAYMAPEQISGAGVEPATDLYALAETLYELLTGRRPYAGTALGIMRDKLKGTRQRWSCRRRCRPRASCARCWRPAWPRCPASARASRTSCWRCARWAKSTACRCASRRPPWRARPRPAPRTPRSRWCGPTPASRRS